jgi:hypothetical protein
MWLLPAPRSASIPAACVPLARRRRALKRESQRRPGAGPAAASHEVALQPGRWPGRFPPDGTDPTGTLARGMRPWSFATGPHPRRFVRPAVWMFATALAPWLCASEARPSDRGIQISRHPTAKPSFQPHVRRETVAAGRGLTPATVRAPGAGPASPDIASSGVSEGGTGVSLKREKGWGMKKCIGL